MKVKSTEMLGGGSQGFVVALKTDQGTYGMEVFAPNQSDLGAGDGKGHQALPPARVFTHVRSLTPKLLRTLETDPTQFAKQANATFFTRVRAFAPKGLLLAASTSPRKHAYRPAHDRKFVIASAGLRADIVALPSVKGETEDTIMERMGEAKAINDLIPAFDRKHIAPTVRMDNPRVVKILHRLRAGGAEVIFLEFHGSANIAPRLVEIADIVRRAAKPPYLVGINVPRMAKPTDASGVLWACAYGIQVATLEVKPYLPGAKKSEADLKWFVRSQGGYAKAGAGSVGTDCGCPDGPSHVIPGGFDAHLSARRRHEGWALVNERDVITRAILGDAFPAYLRSRPVLATAFSA